MKSTARIIRVSIFTIVVAMAGNTWADPGIPAVSKPPAAIVPLATATPTVIPSTQPAPVASSPAAAGVSVGRQVRKRRHRPDSEVDIEKAASLWARTGQAAGVIGDNGTVMYAYGESRPVIHCEPLHLCVIKLMQGEQITDISIGDSVRWKVAASHAGDMPVIVIKPATTGLETNLSILTDAGRVYYMTLRSAAQGAVPLVQFFSPEDIIAKVNERNGQLLLKAQTAQETHDATLGRLDPATLDFHYTCTGKAQFKPTEVFSGNGHIYLKMPDDMKYHDSPAVFDTSSNSTQLINSRFARGYQVLDGLPEKFKLAVGVGSDAETVECTHSGDKTSSNDQSERPVGGDISRFGN